VKVFNRNEVDAACIETVNREVFDLPGVVAPYNRWIRVMRVGAACREHDGTLAESPGLALNACERSTIVDDEVVARVPTKRQENLVTGAL
jgi:hypothetical protein